MNMSDVTLAARRADLEAGDKIQLWECHAFGTRYRALIVQVPDDPSDLFGASLIVAIEPAGGAALDLRPKRIWAPFSIDEHGPLHQQYVESKFACMGDDALAITYLVAKALGRPAVFRAE